MLNRTTYIGQMLALVLIAGVAMAAPKSPSRTPNPPANPPAVQPPAENAWPKLTDEQQAQAVDELKKFSEQTQSALGRPLRLYETKYFLFYSDMPDQQSQNWASLLDRMYARLAEMFAIPKGENLWRGKALVFVFLKQEDYFRYERQIAKTDPTGTAGMCECYGSGLVKIAFYREPEELQFAHVLVHESVHGFVHRYRSPVYIPSWANEGLAETIATDLVPQRGRRDMVKSSAREELKLHSDRMQGFFTLDHIQGWQYPVAEMMCTFMIQAGKKNYVEFINGIKDGLPWDQALETKFKAPVDRLVPTYGQWLGIRGLEQ